MKVQRFEVFLVDLEPTLGREIRKTRPCVVVSPDEMNRHLETIIVAPMSTRRRPYPTRVDTLFDGQEGQIVLDQIRTVDSRHLVKKLGVVNSEAAQESLAILRDMFS